MPRVRATGGASGSYAQSPVKSMQIPLNDDDEEKAQRLQNRKALHSRQMSSLKAAATTPQRKRKSLGRGEGGPATPIQDDDDPYGVRGDHVTPMKRVPILANFETWMKMATDNKINANNSWDFALIDYFHDMSLLKEGNGVNFQKASCTLDGCVKIYTSRVDSVATETGKLLSGLADSGNKKRKGGEAEDGAEEGDEDEENEDGTKKKGRKKAQRSAEATLATSFETLKLKKMELEFSVDPLFKKAAADFDEGGAKGLLMNHLSIDSTGRIVFDSSDDAQDADVEDSRRDSMEPEGEEDDKTALELQETVLEDGPVDVAALGLRFFPDLNMLDTQDICPSLKTFELGGGDGALDLPFLKAPENWRDEHPEADSEAHEVNNSGINLNDQIAAFGDDDDAGPLGVDMPDDVGFGEGGEAWARDTALQPQMRVYDASAGAEAGDDAAGEVGVFDTNSNAYGVTLQHRPHDQENILNYFDNALQKNWAGPEHWKIARIKEANTVKPTRTRKEKEPFEIDFAAPMSQALANLLYTSAPTNSSICLPKKEWKSKNRNLLPDDKHFNSKDLLKLFLKPKAKMGARRNGQSGRPLPANGEVDEAYWAAQGRDDAAPHPMDAEDAVQGDYDANFFQDDGLPMAGGAMDDDDDDFADAREHFSPGADDVGGPAGTGIDSVAGPTEGGAGGDAFGANLVAQSRRTRPEYVQYARVAKKVDVRRLKEEMWRGIGFEQRAQPQTPAARPIIPALSFDDKSTLKFTDIMNNLQHVYPKQQMGDISTSYGFICLLHLANEKGLVIENVDDWTDLTVKKDFGAIIAEGDI
ncbi:Putative condensin complex subunit 2/barren [Septoria linicola]|uniref:Condensin complex subunit 2 n=1 Tax=Septoria linicola TaxID=215465 RepID=A0A9Q9B7F1_9PEZI|nr:Putative condensin complex subunit 2/barren [Septoria linicola]